MPPRTKGTTPRRRKRPTKHAAAEIARGPAVLNGPFTAMMSVKDLSNYLNVSRSTIRRLYKSGQIPGTKVGNRIRFDALAVKAALDKRT